jgi:hypothetical protein
VPVRLAPRTPLSSLGLAIFISVTLTSLRENVVPVRVIVGKRLGVLLLSIALVGRSVQGAHTVRVLAAVLASIGGKAAATLSTTRELVERLTFTAR